MLLRIAYDVLNDKGSFPLLGLSEYLPYDTFRFDFTGCGNTMDIFVELSDLRDVVIHARGLRYSEAGSNEILEVRVFGNTIVLFVRYSILCTSE
jgi:hypothetical protein